MKLNEVDELLKLINGFDRRPFPESASRAWYEVLRNTDWHDAKAAVVEYFSTGAADTLPTLLPGRVRSGAARHRDMRLAAERPAIAAPAPKPAAQTRSEAFLAAREQIRATVAASSEKIHRRDPALRPYKHRETVLVRVA